MRAFVEIVDHGSLTAAAGALDRAPPTMVRTLAALEQRVGARLLNRTTRSMSLTEEGRVYVERCRRILADVSEAEAAVSSDGSEPRGEIRLTAPVLFGQRHVLPALVDFARPLDSAKYLAMETFQNAAGARGQNQAWYPWPYVEGLAIEEATNDLAFIATGLYGKPMPRQNGAPLRLAVPWKYGLKSVKSLVRFTFSKHARRVSGSVCRPPSTAFGPTSIPRCCTRAGARLANGCLAPANAPRPGSISATASSSPGSIPTARANACSSERCRAQPSGCHTARIQLQSRAGIAARKGECRC